MHIVQLLSRSDIGGGQEVVWNLVRTFAKEFAAIRVTVALPPGGVYVARFRMAGIDTVEIPLNRLAPGNVSRVRALLANVRPDVLHTHGKGAGVFGRAFSGAVPLHIHSFHGFHPPGGSIPQLAYLALERALGKRTQTFVAVSQSEADALLQYRVARREDLVIVPNVVDAAALRLRAEGDLPPDLEEFIQRIGDSQVVTMIARNDPLKNYPLAMEAVRRAFRVNLSLGAVFIGLDPAEPKVAALAGEFPGRLYALPCIENPAPLIRRSGAVLLTSRREACPLVLLESACLGTPTIATNVPGIRDVVSPEVNGILCDETAESVAAGIVRLATDEALRAHLGKLAEEGSERVTMTEWAAAYVSLYRKGLEGATVAR